MTDEPINPIHQDEDDGKWYFWDEVWVDRYGPYDTEAEARAKLDQYTKEVLNA